MAGEIVARAEARARGLTKYFTGKPCKNGHIAERRVANGICDLCYRDIDRRCRDRNREKYRAKWKKSSAKSRSVNPEAHRRKDKKWREANPEKIALKKTRWRAANPEKVKEQDRRRRLRKPEYFRHKNKAYKTKHAARLAPIARERARKWQIENPDAVRRNVQARRARKKGVPGSHSAAELRELLELQNWQCIGCDADLHVSRTIDHIIPLSKPGSSNDIANLQWLCRTCNSTKHDRNQDDWLREIGRIR